MSLLFTIITIKEYIDSRGRNAYAKWFNPLNAPAAARVVTALVRMGQGNFSNTKSIGEGVLESRIDFGPGYRIYFGRDGDNIVIQLGGGTKKQQQKDIENAKILGRNTKEENDRRVNNGTH